MKIEEKYECLSCGAFGDWAGNFTVYSRCPKCNSIYIIPMLIMHYSPTITPKQRRAKFKLLRGGLDNISQEQRRAKFKLLRGELDNISQERSMESQEDGASDEKPD